MTGADPSGASAPAPRAKLLRAGAAPDHDLRHGRGRSERLVGAADGMGAMVVSRVTIHPSTPPGPFHLHRGADNVYLAVEGTLEVRVDDEVHHLGAGEAIFIPAGRPHATHNPTLRPVRLLAIYDQPIENDFVPVTDRPERQQPGREP
jgi:mannose-6-phosphate isomerase-like protein (cupin superfamily)